ncbi:hypothetical protein ASPZODRAFT_100142 [Penicilliopsis zonata CBS 506.65]|uniref:Cell surface protein n=1 Tax=Penicilliopsis zonata CBS 506.65 TaxID=1073090 RepID=A0A1L9SCY1_9EURO|nr:hypothetical protein ASPZODRAFT_100142 [Penicilliopsis zonata CBS 506.65]OJJ45019.1 hypothetical protein ASPZODRAFT_100142 [Penicilliopsis zonata CBS 506.65]
MKTTVLVPLYIYPLPQAWDPLFQAIQDYPHVSFLIIVNPNSGPGTPEQASPDDAYRVAVSRLHAFPNVATVGYVLVDYTRRPLHEVTSDIDRYAAWAALPGLALGGILLDETPNRWTHEAETYLATLTRQIKKSFQNALVVHNPGTPPDPGLTHSADVVVTCEESYSRWKSDEIQTYLRRMRYPRGMVGYQLNAVPIGALGKVVREVHEVAAYVFATEVEGDFYERFGRTSWKILLDEISQLTSQAESTVQSVDKVLG